MTITLKFELDAEDEDAALCQAGRMSDEIDVATVLRLDADEVEVDALVEEYARPGADAGDHQASLHADRAVGL
ncbi:hypothetical protein BJF84_13485 [Rhodococcus sp. CUA-806]|nr:hypothetical protein BJF84_13485 [Rhodococcus sp. CUA-806]